MTQRIKWLPSNAPNVIAYEILKSDEGIDAEYSLLVQVLHQVPGNNYDNDGGYFFYDDIEIPYRFYRIRVLDQYGNIAEDDTPTPFQAGNDPAAVPSLYYLALTEHTGGQNNLQYVTSGGTPIEGALIRVYKKSDWDAENTEAVIGTSITNSSGNWSSPILVAAGETYTIVYNKVYEYGPDTVEITV